MYDFWIKKLIKIAWKPISIYSYKKNRLKLSSNQFSFLLAWYTPYCDEDNVLDQ